MKKQLFSILIASASLLLADSWEDFKHGVLQTQQTLPGWCSQEKAQKLMDMVAREQPAVWVEIGVFGGSSVYPVAKALKHFDCGKLYAIDPWMAEACTSGYDATDVNAIWWSSLNLEEIYQQFCQLIRRSSLKKHCTIVRSNSAQALALFEDESIDVLHIDGNHTEQASMFDVTHYLPKVKIGGWIWMDDSNWPTTQRAVDFLYDHCEIHEELSIGEACLCFRKI